MKPREFPYRGFEKANVPDVRAVLADRSFEDGDRLLRSDVSFIWSAVPGRVRAPQAIQATADLERNTDGVIVEELGRQR
jgi:hypothetical protein